MILDYDWDARNHKFVISYINEKGTKSFYEFNINRFKDYVDSPTGKFTNWNGVPCEARYTDRPSKFAIKEFVEELPENIKEVLFNGKYVPKVYTWDIETKYDPAEKPNPLTAKFPITSMSIVNQDFSVMVLGYKDLTQEEQSHIEANIADYLDKLPFYHELNKTSHFIYKKFENEHDMLAWFCKNIVSKVPILAGWNSDGFDQQYTINRIKNYYEDISVSSMSCKYRMDTKKAYNPFNPNESTRIPTPHHTLMIDMMDIIKQHDYTVLPIKESMKLDWIAEHSVDAHKIEYDGDLNELYENDFERFIFYNAIDSVLVQLINYKFKTLNLIYNYANVCHTKIGDCFGKIGPAESLFFMQFHSEGKKVIWYPDRQVHRGVLIGAYVKEPTAGHYMFPCCFDFSGLYPTNVQCYNLSVENFIGGFYDETKLEPYRKDPANYIVTGPNVYKNAGKLDKPKLGAFVAQYLDEEKLAPYRKDPNYIVSINGSVYKNDKDYAFKKIQLMLKSNRNQTKYLAKNMDAQVMSIIDRVIKTGKNGDWSEFTDDVKDWMVKNYNISDKHGVVKYPDLKELKTKIQEDIDYMYMREQSFKLLMNSCYGGSSHESFYWYNMAMANDITGEGRNLIHMMERKTEDLFRNFADMTDIHKKLGVTVDKKYCGDHVTNCISTIYQDTDSSYVNFGPIVNSIIELRGKTDLEKGRFLNKFAEEFINGYFGDILTNYIEGRHGKNYHLFELETIGLSGIWIGVKKRYAQAILCKDGRFYDEPKLKFKGLEVIKGSYPSYSRKILKELMNMLLLDDTSEDNYIYKLNQKMMQHKQEFYKRPIDDITEAISISDYWKGVESDTDKSGVICKPGASFNVKALALYNWLINTKNLSGENIYGGKVKCYAIKKRLGQKDDTYFAYSAGHYPKWADQYAPIDKDAMFQKTVLEPINRILTAIGFKELHLDGYIDVGLFDGMF